MMFCGPEMGHGTASRLCLTRRGCLREFILPGLKALIGASDS
jgi:hypothetical protein